MLLQPLGLYTSDWASPLWTSDWANLNDCEEESQDCSDEDAFGDSRWAKFSTGIGPCLSEPLCVFEGDRKQTKIS